VHVNRVRHAATLDLEQANDSSGNPYEGQSLERKEPDVSPVEDQQEEEEYGPITYFPPDRAEVRQREQELDDSFHSASDEEEDVRPDPTPIVDQEQGGQEQGQQGAAGLLQDPWGTLARHVFPATRSRTTGQDRGPEWEASSWWIPSVPLEYKKKKK
jgi:hypothetical protein